jgi:hypothetical protein
VDFLLGVEISAPARALLASRFRHVAADVEHPVHDTQRSDQRASSANLDQIDVHEGVPGRGDVGLSTVATASETS